MLNERRIDLMLELLDEAASHFRNGTKPDDDWASRVNWLVYDTRRDIDLERVEFEGYVPYIEVKKLEDEKCELEEDNIGLQNQLDEAPDQDEFNELVEENEDLRRRIAELEKGGQDAGLD